jgi:hypothetical protein
MKRLLAKIGRFFWSWRFLKFTLWAVTLIALFYAEEDWRGARDWAQTKARWEAKGESFDFNRLIPPSVPDSENLAALPLFKLEPDPAQQGRPAPLALRRVLREDQPEPPLPSVGGGQNHLPDFEKISREIAARYEAVFHAAPTGGPLNQLEALYPFIEELRTASARRPFCRFTLDYTSQPAYARSLSLITLQLTASRILELHAVLALHDRESDVALSDLKLMAKLAAGTAQEPMLVSGLVSVAMTAQTEAVIAVGLPLHAWRDNQLADVQGTLETLRPLANYQFALRGELTGFSLPTLDYLKERHPFIGAFFSMAGHQAPFYARDCVYVSWPGGWFDQNKCQSTDLLLESLAFVDPRAHRAFPQRGDEVMAQVRDFARHWDGFAAWRIFSSVAVGPILNSAVIFSQAQVKLDEARLACALERCRLAHGAYPTALDELAPAFIAEVPHDVMNGEPYRYRLQPDGTFLLYSVGWDQKDDGGVTVTSLPASADPDDSPRKHGDG